MRFIDLQAQRAQIADKVDSAIARVVEDGRYVMGPDVAAFEAALSDYAGAARTVACANGTDALALPLMAWGIRPGDAIFAPSFTFVATAQVIPWLGAEPVFVDVDPDTYTMDPESLAREIARVRSEGRLTPRAVIAVDLFGQPADYRALAPIAHEDGLKLIADTAQGFGCTLDGDHPVSFADIATTSFFPAKPLGCYGDGGAVLTNDPDLADLIDSLRVYGKVTPADAAARDFRHDPKYLSLRVGMNSRLDSIQAAVLLEKLKIFDDELAKRDAIAARYAEGLAGHVAKTPVVIPGGRSVWAQYTIEHEDRDGLAAHLKAHEIPSAVYYPVPIHMQDFCARYPAPPCGLPASVAASQRVISLPMHPYLSIADQDRVIDAVASFQG